MVFLNVCGGFTHKLRVCVFLRKNKNEIIEQDFKEINALIFLTA